ncbi:MAG: flagellar basal body rod protein FlgB [Anaerolineales bacterium]|nr:flagellar basal body rod protein FlgB [Anaerolineales bacterium]
MSDSIVSDTTTQVVKSALNGLSRKQEVISQNLANVDTPAYQAQSVDFQTTLNNTLNGTGTLRMAKNNIAHMDSASSQKDFVQISNRKGGTDRADGNNVDIDVEMVDMTETVINYQAIVQALTKKFTLLKQIIK